jgi:hypothetical protein
VAGSAILSIKILSDASGAKRGLDSAASSMDKFKSGVRKAAIPAALVGAAILKFGADAVQSASRTEQAMGGVDAVFGKNADTVKKWADSAAGSIGLAKSEYGELATLIGSQLSNAGLPLDVVTKKTKGLIDQGADLAAMFGGTTADAVGALSSAMKGEFDPLEKYGTSLSAAKIKAEMAAAGTDKLTGKAAAQAKTMATLKLITQQTAKAHGAAAREQDTAAARAQQLSASVENLKSDLGTALLPIVAAVGEKLAVVARWMSKNITLVQIIVGVIATMVAVILALNAAISIYNILIVILGEETAAAWLAALGPIGLVILAVVAVVAVIVILWKKSETFRAVVKAVWAAIKAGAQAMGTAIKAVWKGVLAAARTVSAVVKAVWKAVWRVIGAAVRAYLAVARAVFGAIRTAVTNVTSAIKGRWKALWAAVADLARGLRDKLKTIWDSVKDKVGTVTDSIKGVWDKAIKAIKDTVDGLGKVLSKPFDTVKTAIDDVKTAIDHVVTAVGDLIKKIAGIHFPKMPNLPFGIGKSAPKTAAAGIGPATYTRGASRAGPGGTPAGTGTVINIYGALDPEGTARTVRRVLDGHDRRVGRRAG